ncbi:MAG: sigma-70 family RNA polymerase sigma factor [Microbacteriaceae bacterium]|nr:sigma-70 family RNA polymerase sigma factor [Microbacteriaceae bacterium]
MVTDETPEDNEILAGEEANSEDIVIPGSLEWDPSEIETNYVNRGSFEEVYNSVYPRLYRHTVYELDRLYLSKKQVEEVLQTAMGKAYQNWDKYTQGTYALGWLKKIITNTAYNLLRKEKNEPLLFGDMGIIMDAPAYYARSAESSVIESITFDEIRALFDEVREPFRSALKLVILEEMPYQDAADKIGVPLNTMLTRVNRGRTILKELVLTHKREMGI